MFLGITYPLVNQESYGTIYILAKSTICMGILAMFNRYGPYVTRGCAFLTVNPQRRACRRRSKMNPVIPETRLGESRAGVW